MDRTSRIGVFVCLGLLLWIFLYSTPRTLPRQPVRPAALASPLTSATANGNVTKAVDATPAKTPPSPQAAEQIAFLENDSIRVTFTSLGAAIKEVELKKQKEDKTGNVILNEQAHSNILQVIGWPQAESASFSARQNGDGLIYSATLPSGLQWQRTYILSQAASRIAPPPITAWYIAPFVGVYNFFAGVPVPVSAGEYTLAVKDTFTNPAAAELTLPPYGLSVGRAEPLRVRGHYQPISNMYLGCGWLTEKRFHLTTINDFNPGTIPLIGIKTRMEKDAFASTTLDPMPLRWLGAENQFFTVLLTPPTDRLIDHAEFQCFNQRDANGFIVSGTEPDIEATAYFPGLTLPARGSTTLNYTLYAGPKEYDRLNALGDQQGELMNYNGFLPFAYLIVPMLSVLHFFHGLLGNYGVAIILLTLCIKAITWPLQSFANRSGKRMQAVAPKIKELQAKYKEQPEKLNSETFALYKEYGVNPFGGCVPALIQMPVFFSLYYMLQNAVELRRQHFLWVHDLTQPDTIATLPLLGYHLALNPLPLMVTGLTMVMMRMTPQMGDPQQAKIAQFMPLIFLFIFYNFAAALSLYYVINNCVSIIQIYRNLRKPLPELKRLPKKKAA